MSYIPVYMLYEDHDQNNDERYSARSAINGFVAAMIFWICVAGIFII